MTVNVVSRPGIGGESSGTGETGHTSWETNLSTSRLPRTPRTSHAAVSGGPFSILL